MKKGGGLQLFLVGVKYVNVMTNLTSIHNYQ